VKLSGIIDIGFLAKMLIGL
jgi:hypothetical protein